MIKLRLTAKNKSNDDNGIWVDPHQIASIVPDNKTGGSVITLKQNNFFKVFETTEEVMQKCVKAKKINGNNYGNQM